MESSDSRRRRPLWLALLLCLVVAVAGCGNDSEGPSAASSGGATTNTDSEGQPVEFVTGFPVGVYAPGLVIAEKRTWPEHGLDVTLRPVDGSPVVAQQLVAGRAKFGMATAAAVYLAAAEGADIRGVSQMMHDGSALLSVLEDSEIQSVDDLKGKAIGVTSASDGAIPLVEAVLADAGFSKDDYTLPVVGAGGPAAAQALKSGRIAAYAHGISDVGGMEAGAGVKLRSIMPEKFVGLPDNLIAVRSETLANADEAQIAAKLAQGWIEAGEFLAERPDEAYEIVCDELPEQCEDEATARAVIERATLAHVPEQGDEPGVIDPAKAETLIRTLRPELPIPIDEVFPPDALPGAK